ncbi:TetR family transcriptional regulator [Pontibacillus halophilus JSM 076056 = DSM 19796]|uniref:TetR family transcriptional regulator n=1 Tax=Pontibacillus halophilus JSM 076056 = DSM 19796 TaxID=1385510 RepID=A0A0A5GFN4_9BACI|nr:TetR/AcrR family transcriptional regulator [Pontibacillus halophilus]KGX92031.1 TetR family transcriptional regulator [Pontibacillus halophilus JSM 076056 = DSM 19796]
MPELREKVIQSSLELFAEKGFHRVSVNEIVQHCGVSKGGFYHYFKSKDELLYVIHDTFITYVLEKAQLAVLNNTHPTYQLHAIIHSFVKVFDLYQLHISVFYQESIYLTSPFEERIKEKRDRFKDLLLAVIKNGQQQDQFRTDLPPQIATMSILGMVNWTYKWYSRDGEKSIDEIADYFYEFISRALLPEDFIMLRNEELNAKL